MSDGSTVVGLLSAKNPRLRGAFRVLINTMKRKDPSLFERIRLLPVPAGISVWRERHPEDFPNGLLTLSPAIPE